MANHRPKGVEYMRELGRRGGLNSGRTRHLRRAEKVLLEYAAERSMILPQPLMPVIRETRQEKVRRKRLDVIHSAEEIIGRRFAAEEIAELLRPTNRSGGSHDLDWRCPYCRHFNSIQRWSCARCFRAPQNGRKTRAALRERAAEHRNTAILRKHGL
jgi:hypothetical protein